MKFYYNDYLYTQRTPTSKILCFDKNDNLLTKYNDIKDLPSEIYYEYLNVKNMEEYPEKVFGYTENFNDSITINSIPKNTQNLIIPESIEGKAVTDINYELNLDNIRYIKLPSKFRKYPESIFSNCKNLYEVYISDGTCVIDNGSFALKKNLKKVHLPKNIDIIPSSCFFGCENLTDINLENVKEIQSNAFCKCTNLKNIKLSDKLKLVDFKAFYKSNVRLNESLPETTKIGKFAFDVNEIER